MAMKKFQYVALDLQKNKIKGSYIANDEKDLTEQLAKQSLFVISCKPYPEKTQASFFTLGTGKVKVDELTPFCRQFSIMINTGIPILECLDILKTQNFTPFLIKVLNTVYDDVKSGMMLSDAMKKHPKVFPEFFQSMVYVGEQSGKLDQIFSSLADYYERDATLRRKTRSAASYPAFLGLLSIGIIVLMFTMVVPTFRSTMESMEIEEVGALTQAIYDISDFFSANWQYVVLVLLIVVATIFITLRTEKGKYAKDFLKLHIPFLKKVESNILTSRFARAFSVLLSSGMDIASAMDVVEVILGNRYLKKRFHAAAEGVRHGMSLTLAFESYKLFPKMMNQMVQVGEHSGTLDDVLGRACTFFDDEVETSLNSLVSKLQPIMLIAMGAIIGVLFIAVYSPMLSIMNNLNV